MSSPRAELGTVLLRGCVRGVVAAAALAPLAWWLGVPVASAVYVGGLALPCAVVEWWAFRRTSTQRVSELALPLWFVAFAAIAVAHFQAVYGMGVLEARGLAGGAKAVEEELRRFVARDRSLELPSLWLTVVLVGGVAIALVCSALAGPIASREFTWNGPRERRGALVLVYAIALSVATFVVTAFMAFFSVGAIVCAPFFFLLLAFSSIPGLVAFGAAEVVAEWLVGERAAQRSDSAFPPVPSTRG